MDGEHFPCFCQAGSSSDTGPSHLAAASVAVFLLFDVLEIVGLGLPATSIGAGNGPYHFTVGENQALTIGLAVFLFALLTRRVDAH